MTRIEIYALIFKNAITVYELTLQVESGVEGIAGVICEINGRKYQMVVVIAGCLCHFI